MSGIFGIINLNQAPVAESDLSAMAETLKQRGPDGQSLWRDGAVGLGHTLLATTPSALFEHLPLRDSASGCVITADARIDNREELMVALGIDPKEKATGDAELILRSYLKWGHACPQHLMGDFTFAIWNPHKHELFCARDHFGMRPFNYYYAAGKVFAFASSVPAVLALKQVPKKINEARIADFLYDDLEGVDTVSTFYENVYRLPSAHSLCVSSSGLEVKRYWSLVPGPMLNLSSNADYVEAFLEVFTASVKSRLVSADPAGATLGSMLSGGMDSGSVVAIASRLLSDQGFQPLKTFSGVGPALDVCVETRSIHAAIGIGKIAPQLVSYSDFGSYLDEIRALTLQMEEPFEGHMSLIRAIYLDAHRKGVKVMLDGVAGDVILGDGSQLARLIRSGHWLQAIHDVFGLKRFYGQDISASRLLLHSARTALIPDWAWRLKRRLWSEHQVIPFIASINPAFARRVDVKGRLEQFKLHNPALWQAFADERAKVICNPFMVVARERYNRIASVNGIEPRDPFLDRRVVDFCLRLPSRKLQAEGWPKLILRQAMAGRLPDSVRWRLGKEHLGPEFTLKVFHDEAKGFRLDHDDLERLSPYLSSDLMTIIRKDELKGKAKTEIISLAVWLRRTV